MIGTSLRKDRQHNSTGEPYPGKDSFLSLLPLSSSLCPKTPQTANSIPIPEMKQHQQPAGLAAKGAFKALGPSCDELVLTDKLPVASGDLVLACCAESVYEGKRDNTITYRRLSLWDNSCDSYETWKVFRW
eukprot:gb/GECG01004640.1/.p1 GENE.gb/GECG01004640.1/~~gb/GECG01004640.1/.p1  ORF type:complete len:131 (+),score=5.97 gb/GECG01004640.1/:1-393(+)